MSIFSHSVGCLFILSMVPFAVQELFEFGVAPLVSPLVAFALVSNKKKKVIAKNDIKELTPLCLILEVLQFQVLNVSL